MGRRARAILGGVIVVSACLWTPLPAAAAPQTVYTMVIGPTPYALNSITTNGSGATETVTVTLPISEAQPLEDAYTAYIHGLLNPIATVDFYTSSGGYGVLDEISHVFVIRMSSDTLTRIATAEFSLESIRIACSGADTVCEPAALPRLSLTSSVNPADLAQQTTLTASRASYPNGPSDTGTVAFSSDGVLIPGCEAVGMIGGQATCVTSFGTSGPHTIKADDGGDFFFIADSATLTQTVNTSGTLVVTVSGSQKQGSTTPAFTASDTPPPGISVDGSPSCTGLTGGVVIGSSLGLGSYSIDPATCSGLSLSGSGSGSLTIAYAGGAFTVTPAVIIDLPVTVTGTQDTGSSSPSFSQSSSPPSGLTVSGTVTCTGLTGGTAIASSLATGAYTIDPATCSGLSLGGTFAADYVINYVGGAFTVVDRTAPTVTLTGTPSDPSADPQPSFTFTLSDPDDTGGLVAACSFDGGAFAACTSPVQAPSTLVDGLHAFGIHASDPAGNTSTDIGYIWNVSAGASAGPTIFTLNAGLGSVTLDSAQFSGVPTDKLAFTAVLNSDLPAASMRGRAFDIVLSASHAGRTMSIRASGFLVSLTLHDTTPPTLTETFVFGSFTASVSMDTTPPAVSLTGTPSNPSNSAQPTFTFTISDPDDSSGFTAFCSFDGGAFDPCTSPASPPSALADGTHTFAVHAVDPAANLGPDTTYTWLLDTTPPLITLQSRTPANANGWNNGPVTLVWSCSDPESGVVAATVSATLSQEGAGQSTTQTCQDRAGNTSSDTESGINIDLSPPAIALVSRTPANAQSWNNTSVTLVWSCTDALSGPAAATVTQTVSTEGANQSATGTCTDLAGNVATDTEGGVNIDETAPSVTFIVPNAADSFLIGQAATVSFSCADNAGGSGILSCVGTAANGSALDTSSVGTRYFTITATDLAGNVTSRTISYTVTYRICLLYDPTKAVHQGATMPVKFELCDANGNDLSSAALTVHATGIVLVSVNSTGVLEASGSSNPDSDFRFDSTLGTSGGYIFNVSTKSLIVGVYVIQFTVGSDPTVHTAEIQVH